jgi:hypothetical protein
MNMVRVGIVVWNGKVYDVDLPSDLSNKLPYYTAGWRVGKSIGFIIANPEGGVLKEGVLKEVKAEKIDENYDLKRNICGVFSSEDSDSVIPVLYYYGGGSSRKAFLKEPVKINDKPYIIEIKGVGNKGKEIDIQQLRMITPSFYSPPIDDTGPIGGLPYKEAMDDVEVMKKMNENGIYPPLFISLYRLPLMYTNLRGENDSLAVEVRGTDSTMRASWINPNFNKYLFGCLNTSSEEYARVFSKKTLKAYHTLLDLGYLHISPHEDNLLLTGGITDLGDTINLKDAENSRVKSDLEYFVFSFFNVLQNSRLPEENSEKWNKVVVEILNDNIREEFDFDPNLSEMTFYEFNKLIEKMYEKLSVFKY